MRALMIGVLVMVGCRAQGGDAVSVGLRVGGEQQDCAECEELKGELLERFEEMAGRGARRVEDGLAGLVWVEGSLGMFNELLVDAKVRADLRERAVRDDFAEVEVGLGRLVDVGVMLEVDAGGLLEQYRASMVERLGREQKVGWEGERRRLSKFEAKEEQLLERVRGGDLSDEQGLLELREFWSELRAEAGRAH